MRHFVEQALKPPAGSWEHRFHQPVVQVWGSLAVVWTKYSFHDREQLRYCGSEGYQLMQTPDGWRIVAVANHFQQGDCAEFITAHTQ